jgi:hypothetical protein
MREKNFSFRFISFKKYKFEVQRPKKGMRALLANNALFHSANDQKTVHTNTADPVTTARSLYPAEALHPPYYASVSAAVDPAGVSAERALQPQAYRLSE